MLKKAYLPFALLIIFSMLLGACATPNTPTVQAPAPTMAPTDPPAPPAPTAEPQPEPEPEPVATLDIMAIGQAMFSALPADKAFGSVSAAKLNEELADTPPFLVDLRQASELENDGYIEGSIHIPIRDLFKNLDKLPGLDDPIVVYCGVGHRGGFALAALTSIGYTKVRSLSGGLSLWKSANLPLVPGAPEAAASISQPVVEDQVLFEAWDEFLTTLPEGFFLIRPDKLGEALADNPPFVLDLRTTAEVDRDGYIDGGLNIPMHELLANLDKLPAKDAPIVAYCGIGHRGALALPVLRMLGYENVTSLYLGMRGWKSASMPVAGWVNWQSVYAEYFAGMPANFYVIRPDALNTALAENPPFLVDLREASEIEQNGYITGSVHIPVSKLLKNLDKLPAQDQPIVLICASGHRGGIALPALQLLGYTNVTNLVGGVGAWKKADFPVETGMPAAAESISSPVVDATRLRDLDAYMSAIPANLYAVKPGDLNLEIGEGTVPFIIDNRTEAEWNNGYIEGSVHIPINELFARLSEMPSDKSTPMVVVCQSGHRGGIALIALMMIGYTDVRNLGGGVNAWVGAEFPVIQ